VQPLAEFWQRAQLNCHTHQHKHNNNTNTHTPTHMYGRSHYGGKVWYGMARGWPLIFMAISFISFACTFPCKVVN